MVRIIVGLIALFLGVVIGIFGLPIICQDGFYCSIAIVFVFILLVIAYLCLARPLRDFINENF